MPSNELSGTNPPQQVTHRNQRCQEEEPQPGISGGVLRDHRAANGADHGGHDGGVGARPRLYVAGEKRKRAGGVPRRIVHVALGPSGRLRAHRTVERETGPRVPMEPAEKRRRRWASTFVADCSYCELRPPQAASASVPCVYQKLDTAIAAKSLAWAVSGGAY